MFSESCFPVWKIAWINLFSSFLLILRWPISISTGLEYKSNSFFYINLLQGSCHVYCRCCWAEIMYANNNSPAPCIVILSSIYTYVFHFVHHKRSLVGHVLVTNLLLISNIRGSQPWATHSCRRGSHVGVQLPLWFSERQAPQQNKHCSSWCERKGARFTELGCYVSKKSRAIL